MKKVLTIILINIAFLMGVVAQTTEQQVISNAGNYSEAAGMSLSWTLGETLITTVGNGSMVFTQGFQQPMYMFNGQMVVVPAGWSGISSYVLPDDPLVENIFAPNVAELTILMNGFNQIYWPDEEINTIGNWNTHHGYKIKVTEDVTVIFEGDEDLNKVVSLDPGWSIIPVLSSENVSTTALFGPLGTDMIIAKEIAGNRIYWPSQGIITLNFLEPGKAYQILMDPTLAGPWNLDFGATDMLANGLESNIELNKVDNNSIWNDCLFTGNSHTLAITEKALSMIEGLQAGDYIGVFNQSGICSGMLQFDGDYNNVALTAFADDHTTASFTEGLNENEYMSFKLYRPATSEEFILEAEFDAAISHTDLFASDGLSRITGFTTIATGIEDPYSLNDVEIYPNPANDWVTLNCVGNLSDNAELFVYSIEEGKLVIQQKVSNNLIQLNINELASGVYIVKVLDGEKLIVKKLVKNRNRF